MSGAFSSYNQANLPAVSSEAAILGALSPLAPASERAAVESLMAILAPEAGQSSAPGTATEGKYSGTLGTGNIAQDARDAYSAGLFGFAANLAQNPASLVTSVPSTMISQAIRGLAGLPDPTSLRSGFGPRGLANTIGDLFGPSRNAYGFTQQQLDNLGYGGFSDAGLEGAMQANDAISAGFGPESPGYGAPGGGPGEGDKGDFGGGDFGAESTSGGEDGGQKAKGGLVRPTDGRVIPLAGGGKIAIGPGGGLDDLIPTSINGRRAAALSDGEFVIPADVVSMFGDGSTNAGARRLYDLVRQVRKNKTGQSEQAGPLPVGEILKRSLR